MSLPSGAFDIAVARDNGQRPADPVIVNCTGEWLNEANPQVLVTRPDHDWRFLAGLEAIVFSRRGAPLLAQTLRGIAPYADDVALWDTERSLGVELWPMWRVRGVVAFALPARIRGAVPPLPQRYKQAFLGWRPRSWTRIENKAFAA